MVTHGNTIPAVLGGGIWWPVAWGWEAAPSNVSACTVGLIHIPAETPQSLCFSFSPELSSFKRSKQELEIQIIETKFEYI